MNNANATHTHTPPPCLVGHGIAATLIILIIVWHGRCRAVESIIIARTPRRKTPNTQRAAAAATPRNRGSPVPPMNGMPSFPNTNTWSGCPVLSPPSAVGHLPTVTINHQSEETWLPRGRREHASTVHMSHAQQCPSIQTPCSHAQSRQNKNRNR